MNSRDTTQPFKFEEFIHATVARSVEFLDTKATVIIGFDAATMAFELHDYNSLKDIAQKVHAMLGGGRLSPDLSFWTDLTGAASLAVLAAAFFFAFWCIRPRFGTSARGLIYYGSVANYKTPKAFADAASNTSDDEAVQAVLTDAHSLARIARMKAGCAVWATWLTAAGLILVVAEQVIKAWPQS